MNKKSKKRPAAKKGSASIVDVADLKEAEEALRPLNFELEEQVSDRTAELQAVSLYARSLIEASLDPLLTISPEGRITDVNEATEQATGRTRKELIGTDFSDYFTVPDSAQAGYRKVLAEGQVRDYPLTIRHTSGNTTDVLYNATVYRNQAGEVQGVFAAARDITEVKRAEAALREANKTLEQRVSERTVELQESRQRLAVIVESIADGFYALDKEWRFIHVNDAALRHMGKTSEEILGRTLFDLYPEARGSAIANEYESAMESGESRHFETPSLVTGRILEIHAYPGPENLTVLFRDITEKHRMATALREAHERAEWLARFPEENPNPVVRVSADGGVLYCNPASAETPEWGCAAGRQLPEPLLPLFAAAMTGGQEIQQDIELSGRYYSVTIVPIPGKGYANIYGRDITARKQAEEALQTTLQRLHALVAGMQSSLLLVGEGRIEMANQAFCDYFGLEDSPGDLVGLTPRRLIEKVKNAYIHADEQVTRIWEIARGGQPVIGEELSMRDGRTSLRDFIPIYVDGKSYGLLWHHIDITERKRAEAALHESEARFRLLSGTAGRLLHAEDPQTVVEELCRDVMAHLDCQTFFNFLVDEKAGRLHLNACAGIPEEDARAIEWLDYGVAICGCVAQEGRRIIAEDILYTPDVRTELIKSFGIQAYCCHPLMSRRRLIGTLSFGTKTRAHFTPDEVELMRIVTDQVAVAMQRKQTEQMILHAKEEWERTFDAVPDLIAILDVHHRILRANKAMAERLGVAVENCVGEACHKAVHGLDYPPDFCPHSLALADGQEHMAEVHEDCLGGDFLVSATPLTDERGRLIGSVHVARDITKRKQAEKILRERTAELEVANKELESFSYSVSHDLRAPLRAIDGYARMILKKEGDKFDEETMRKFNVIRSSSQMMGQLIDDILTLSRVVKKHLSTSQLKMDAVIREVWKELETINPERNIKLTVQNCPAAYGDRTLIKQVYANLLSNAAKFTKGRDPALIETGGYIEGSENVYYVRDNGVGFEMEYYDKLFGIFQRLHKPDEFEGTGVGLAIVERIVQRHGGRAWAEGKVNEGATFYFTLPQRR